MSVAAAAIIAGASVVSAGVGAAGAAGAFSPDAPSPLNYGQITRDALQAQIDLMGPKLAAQQQYDPQTAQLQNMIAYQNLFGSTGGPRQVNYDETEHVPAVYRNGIGPSMTIGGMGGRGLPGYNQVVTPGYDRTVTRSRTVYDQKVPGLLDIAELAGPRLAALMAQSASLQREGAVNDVSKLGPAALAALKGYDPQSTALADELQAEALKELNLGQELDPYQLHQTQQMARANRTGQGFGQGSSQDQIAEGIALGLRGQQLQQQRRAFAGTVLGQRQSLYGDPYQAIIGRSSGVNTNPMGFVNPYGSLLDTNIGPAYGIAQQNQQNSVNAQIAGYNQQQAMLGGFVGNLGKNAQSIWQGFGGGVGYGGYGGQGFNPGMLNQGAGLLGGY